MEQFIIHLELKVRSINVRAGVCAPPGPGSRVPAPSSPAGRGLAMWRSQLRRESRWGLTSSQAVGASPFSKGCVPPPPQPPPLTHPLSLSARTGSRHLLSLPPTRGRGRTLLHPRQRVQDRLLPLVQSHRRFEAPWLRLDPALQPRGR